MQETLFVLQNSYDVIIIEKLIHSQNSPDQQMLEILHIEIQLTSNQIERLHILIHQQLALTTDEKPSIINLNGFSSIF